MREHTLRSPGTTKAYHTQNNINVKEEKRLGSFPNGFSFTTRSIPAEPSLSGCLFPDDEGFFVSLETGEIIPRASVNLHGNSEDTQERLNYLEYIAKLDNGHLSISKRGTYKVDIQPCKGGYVWGECEDYHHSHAKKVYCGKEWCPRCGKNGSDTHKRRMARWWHKVLTMKAMGYLIVTLPPSVREFFKDIERLKEFRRYWIKKLKREGYEKGLSRWHWAGEKSEEMNHHDNGVWHPHLNFFIDAGFVPKEKLTRWKDDFQAWLKTRYGFDVPVVDIWYQYTANEGKKIHWLKYVTRPTLTWFDDELSKLLFGFRATQSWGKWEKIDRESCYEAIEKKIEKISAEVVKREIEALEKKLKEMEGENMRHKEYRRIRDKIRYLEANKGLGLLETVKEIRELMAVADYQEKKCTCGSKIHWLKYVPGELPESFVHVGGGYYMNPEKNKEVVFPAEIRKLAGDTV